MSDRYMAWTPTLGELREEMRQTDPSGRLWLWLRDSLAVYLHGRIRSRYRADLYSPSGEWDEDGVNDLLNEFIIERCLRRGALFMALARAGSTSAAIRILQRSFHNFVISERVRTISDNIYRRMLEVLAEDHELRPLSGIGTRAAYGDAQWEEDPPPSLSAADVSAVMKYFPEKLEVVHYSQGQRQSPILIKKDLQTIARSVIRGAKRLVTAAQLVKMIENRFDLATGQAASTLEHMTTLPMEMTDPLEEVTAAELAHRFVNGLTDRQRQVLEALMSSDPPPSVRDIAEMTGHTKSVVHREQKAIGALIRSFHIRDPREQNQLLSAVATVLELSA